MRLQIIVLLIATFFSAPSLAATVSVSFPSLNGTYAYPDYASPTSFDLGVQFSSIASATIEWTATGTPGSVQLCNINTGLCPILSFDPKAEYYIPSEGYGTGIGPNGSLDLVNTSSTFSKTDMLLDGEGTLYFGHMAMGYIGTISETILVNSTFEVSDVTLTVEGTVVPLPAALPLLMSGLTGLLFFQRKRKLA